MVERLDTSEGEVGPVCLSFCGFDLVRVTTHGEVTVAEHADRTAQQMIASGRPADMLIGHLARLVIAGNDRLKANGNG
jgi:hypothetical protein